MSIVHEARFDHGWHRFQFDETIDVGIDTGTPVDDRDYQGIVPQDVV